MADFLLAEAVGSPGAVAAVVSAMGAELVATEENFYAKTQAQTNTVSGKSIKRAHLFEREARLTAVAMAEMVGVVGVVATKVVPEAVVALVEARELAAAMAQAAAATSETQILRWRTQTMY